MFYLLNIFYICTPFVRVFCVKYIFLVFCVHPACSHCTRFHDNSFTQTTVTTASRSPGPSPPLPTSSPKEGEAPRRGRGRRGFPPIQKFRLVKNILKTEEQLAGEKFSNFFLMGK